MGKHSHTFLESSNVPLISVRQNQWPWHTILDTTLPAAALAVFCCSRKLLPLCPGWQGKPWCDMCFSWTSQATTAIPGMINPAPPSLWYQPSSPTCIIPLLCTSAKLCSFVFRRGDQCRSCFPLIPTRLIFFSLWGIPCLICYGPPIWQGWEGISLFSFDSFSWSLWQLMVILRWNISRNYAFRGEDSGTCKRVVSEMQIQLIFSNLLYFS